MSRDKTKIFCHRGVVGKYLLLLSSIFSPGHRFDSPINPRGGPQSLLLPVRVLCLGPSPRGGGLMSLLSPAPVAGAGSKAHVALILAPKQASCQ